MEKLAKNFNAVFLLIGGFKSFFTEYQKLCESTNLESNFFSNFTSNDNKLFHSSKKFLINDKNIIKELNCTTEFQYKLYQSDLNESKMNKVIDHKYKEINNIDLKTPTKILDFLYLGSQEDALSELMMKVS